MHTVPGASPTGNTPGARRTPSKVDGALLGLKDPADVDFLAGTFEARRWPPLNRPGLEGMQVSGRAEPGKVHARGRMVDYRHSIREDFDHSRQPSEAPPRLEAPLRVRIAQPRALGDQLERSAMLASGMGASGSSRQKRRPQPQVRNGWELVAKGLSRMGLVLRFAAGDKPHGLCDSDVRFW